MDSPKKALRQQRTKVSGIMEMLQQGSGVENDTVDTDVAWLKEFEEEALEAIAHEGEYQGVHTGYLGIDNLLGSLLPGELLTIGGDTGHGKSLLAMNIAQNAYASEQKPVLMVNLELTRPQAVQRFYNLSGAEHDYSGIMIQRASAVGYKDIDIIMKKAKAEGASLVVIDHLHFFSRSHDNETRELSRITKHFKECAVENELPVILLSHVTPTRKMDGDGEVTKTVKPGLHNLKGSSSIEQDSDMVGFVFRSQDDPTTMEFYLRKNRSRPLNTKSAYLKQDGWKLTEDIAWAPNKLV